MTASLDKRWSMYPMEHTNSGRGGDQSAMVRSCAVTGPRLQSFQEKHAMWSKTNSISRHHSDTADRRKSTCTHTHVQYV